MNIQYTSPDHTGNMAFLHASSILLFCIAAFIKESSELPTGQADRAWEISELSPLDPVDIKIAYETLRHSQDNEADLENAVADTRIVTVSRAILGKDQQMEIGKSYYSPSKTYRLVLQSDSNLVLYRECDGQVVFATDNLRSNATAVMQNDGHFIVYFNATTAVPVWSSETWGYGNSQLFLSDSGYFYLCNWAAGCYWRSDSHRTKDCNRTSDHKPSHNYKVLAKSGQNLPLETRLYSNNSKFYVAKYTSDIYESVVVWRSCDHRQSFKAAWPKNSTFGRVTLQEDGNLIILDTNDTPVWSSHTVDPSHAGAELRLYDNGFLYLCDSKGCYWQSSGFLDKCNRPRSN